ncbi:hypothetical protein IFM89_039656 [Coptis chinensis]|uniref:Uncharacterized protein n=1 Tax=Coptis chinensis TaxID=261450 RepID=A0A835LCW3_9MAGN|nr:hypothetical protein IFM89_039656 [Coptis chinensis]
MPPGNRDSTVYVGNLDERVTDKISGQDKSSQKVSTHILPMNSLPNLSSHPPQLNYTGNSQRSSRNYAQPELSPLGMVQPNGYRSSIIGNTPDYSRRVFGAALDSVSHSSHRPYEWKNPNVYPSN